MLSWAFGGGRMCDSKYWERCGLLVDGVHVTSRLGPVGLLVTTGKL